MTAWEDLGCFKDDSSSRAMSERDDYPGILTRGMCLESCTNNVSPNIYIQ